MPSQGRVLRATASDTAFVNWLLRFLSSILYNPSTLGALTVEQRDYADHCHRDDGGQTTGPV
jgi:hypothetical protein